MSKLVHEILNIDSDEELSNLPIETKNKSEITVGSSIENDETDASQLEDDYEYAKQELRDVIDIAKVAAEYMLTIAKDKEDAKSFDALTHLLKARAETAERILSTTERRENIKEKRRKLRGPSEGVNNYNIDKAVFTGTANDLQKFIEENEK